MSTDQTQQKDKQRIHAASPKRRTEPRTPEVEGFHDRSPATPPDAPEQGQTDGEDTAEVEGHLYDPNADTAHSAYLEDRRRQGEAERLANQARDANRGARGFLDRIRNRGQGTT